MNISYRPEIDGLRAVSVLLVILHHLGWTWVSGGYIGVDVFFVISGFLITSIIAVDVDSENFSIGNFYKRRVIRLAPAFFLMMGATSIVSMIVMFPVELLNYARSVIYSLFFSVNYYMREAVGRYFGDKSNVIPLLHLWSLAVEEQFYIFWPPILLFVLKVVRRQMIGPLVFAGVLASLVFSEWGVRFHTNAAYYWMPTRAFELALGALVVFLPTINFNKYIRIILSSLGLMMIFFAAFTYSGSTAYPGIHALLPCVGACLILVFCKTNDVLAGKILSASPMTFIGKISYPAYLWHWPIIVFLNICLIKMNIVTSLCVISATLVLSAITYRFAELPARRWSHQPVKNVLGFGFVLPALLFLCMSLAVKNNVGFPQRFPEGINAKVNALFSYAEEIRKGCEDGDILNPLPADQCILGVPGKSVDFILVGDSFANHFTGMLDIMAHHAGLRGYDVTQSNTIFLPGVRYFQSVGGMKIERERFENRNKVIQAMIEKNKYPAVILGASFATSYDGYIYESDGITDSKQAFEIGFERAINIIQKSGSKVYIIKGSPYAGQPVADCLRGYVRFNRQDNCDINLQKHLESYKEWDRLLAGIVKKYPDVVIIDPMRVLCNDKVCLAQIDGIPLYRDAAHLSYSGSELIGRRYIEKAGNPLLSIPQVNHK